MDKLYILGVRYNPQLGSYLSKVKVAKAKVNKTCISAKFDDCLSTKTLRFSLTPDNSGRHWCLSKERCVYGDYTWLGFSNKEVALAKLAEMAQCLWIFILYS